MGFRTRSDGSVFPVEDGRSGTECRREDHDAQIDQKEGYPYRSEREMTYHGKSGRPLVHCSETGREYIMVRKQGGGDKRLYLVNGDVPEKYKDPVEHRN